MQLDSSSANYIISIRRTIKMIDNLVAAVRMVVVVQLSGWVPQMVDGLQTI